MSVLKRKVSNETLQVKKDQQEREKEIEYERSWEESELDLLTEERTQTKRPNLYSVVMLNDNYTPMDFVVWIIQQVFHKALEEATHLMLDIHNKGSSRLGVFTYDVAQSKVEEVHNLAEKNEHPLQCILEIEESDE